MLATALRGFLVVVASLLCSSAAAQPLVRVLLDSRSAVVEFAFDGPHRGSIDGRAFQTPFALRWPVEAVNGKLRVDGNEVGRVLDLMPQTGLVRYQGREYRGVMRVLARGDQVLVINVVDLEAYLRGVVPAEMQASWPLDALRAQAVAARTYALANLSPAAPYDVCSTSDCQVYRGVRVEHARSDQAVADTAGLVLTYGGAFARTYYHADSGGVIASSAEVWGASIPYLSAFQDVPSDGPHRHWEVRIEPAVVAAHLGSAGHHVGSVSRVRVLANSESGRVQRLEVTGSAGGVILEGADARAQARAWGLKSTRFRMVGDLVFRGEGWGHGVGMSQYGARALALSGHSYGQILAFYYPNTHLQRLTTTAER